MEFIEIFPYNYVRVLAEYRQELWLLAGGNSVVTLAHRIADWLATEGNLPDERRAVITYGALTALNTALGVTLIVVAGWMTGLTAVILCAAAIGAGLRVLTGGAHYTAPWRCSTASAAIYLVQAVTASWLAMMPWTAPGLAALGAGVLAFATWVTLRYSPADTKAYRLNVAKKLRLRRLTILALGLVAAAWALALRAELSPALFLAAALGSGWQMFSVTPAGFAVFAAIDRFLQSIGIGGDNS